MFYIFLEHGCIQKKKAPLKSGAQSRHKQILLVVNGNVYFGQESMALPAKVVVIINDRKDFGLIAEPLDFFFRN